MDTDASKLRSLLAEVQSIISIIEERATQEAAQLDGVATPFKDSARNLLRYLTLRSLELSTLQTRLQQAGLSSLGRSEGQVLANLEQVAARLEQSLSAPRVKSPGAGSGVDWSEAQERLRANSEALFGAAPADRHAYIMVTAPDQVDPSLLTELVEAGMNSLRINCAHGSPDDWRRMAAAAREAAVHAGREVRIFFDLPGPKVRTGAITPGPRVMKVSPRRNALGQVTESALLVIGDTTGAGMLGMSQRMRNSLAPGDELRLVDTRGRRRRLTVGISLEGVLTATCDRTVYVGADTVVRQWRHGKKLTAGRVAPPPCLAQRIDLRSGDHLLLTASQAAGGPVMRDRLGGQVGIPHVPCSLPEALANVVIDDSVYFDDGKIRGVVRERRGEDLLIQIVSVRGKQAKLGSEKGINFPDSTLSCEGMTAADRESLRIAAEVGDGVSLSFVNQAADVRQLCNELRELGRPDMPVILKIETNRAFHNLSAIIMAAMCHYPVGVMIARGDLAVECGFERLAELQEEIMWVCEAAHIPVIWATEVLDSLAKTGVPTRAEVSDAALSARAECVMLNKGPFITQAVETLGHILGRMQGHQCKKQSLLRALHFGGAAPGTDIHSGGGARALGGA